MSCVPNECAVPLVYKTLKYSSTDLGTQTMYEQERNTSFFQKKPCLNTTLFSLFQE